MRAASIASKRFIPRRLITSAGAALVLAAIACGGGSDTTGPGGGGGNSSPPVATVSVTPSSTALLVGVTDSVSLGTATVSATEKDASGNVLSGRTVTWSSSATNIATVSSAGVVTAVGAGSATVTATSEGQTASVSVTVTRPAIASIALTPASATLLVGVLDTTNLGTTSIAATAKDASGHQLSGRTITWASDAPSVATVSSTGVVKAAAAGSANVTATAEGQSGSAPITVTRAAVATVSINPQTSSLKVGATETLVVTPMDSQQHVLSGRIITPADNTPSIISVSGGTITGLAAGTGIATYTIDGIVGTATITVTP